MSGRGDRRTLGRGLSALMAEAAAEEDGQARAAGAALRIVAIDRVAPSPAQPRKDFRKDALQELAESIRRQGVLQPIIVRSGAEPGRYEIVAGERRWRAAALAGLTEVPTIVREFSDVEMLQVAIVENVQRANLNPIEEASGYRDLADRYGHTQDEIATALGKSRSHIANTVRLLNLPIDLQNQVASGLLTAGHARALLAAPDPVALGAIVVGKGLTVRQTEDLVRRSGIARSYHNRKGEKDADTRAIEGDLTATLRMTVTISHGEAGTGGSLAIRYRTLDDLDFLCRVLAAASRDTVI